MLRPSSLIGPVNSGFVPFASGAAVDALADRANAEFENAEAEATAVVARAAATRTVEAAPRTAVVAWQPASSARIRVVEGVVLAAICAYFGWGLLRTLVGF